MYAEGSGTTRLEDAEEICGERRLDLPPRSWSSKRPLSVFRAYSTVLGGLHGSSIFVAYMVVHGIISLMALLL